MADWNVLTLRLDEIVVAEDRARALKADDARAIGEAIRIDGQYSPIAVTRLPGRSDYLLVDGWHRLEGSRMVGLETILAVEISPEKGGRVRREVLSGMACAAHDVFDRAAAIDMLARWARADAGLPEEGDLRAFNGGLPRTTRQIELDAALICSRVSKSLRWDERVAEHFGCSAGIIRRYKIVHERISAEHKNVLRAVGQAGQLVPLLKFAGLQPEDQARAIAILSAGDEVTIAGAIAAIEQQDARREVLSRVDKKSNAFLRVTDSWENAQRRAFFERWNQTYHPDGRRRSDASKGTANG